MRIRFWLIVGEDESVRVRKSSPSRGTLAEDEIGIPVILDIPAAWFGNRTAYINVAVPDPDRPDVAVQAGEPEWQMPEGMTDAYGLDSDEEAQP